MLYRLCWKKNWKLLMQFDAHVIEWTSECHANSCRVRETVLKESRQELQSMRGTWHVSSTDVSDYSETKWPHSARRWSRKQCLSTEKKTASTAAGQHTRSQSRSAHMQSEQISTPTARAAQYTCSQSRSAHPQSEQVSTPAVRAGQHTCSQSRSAHPQPEQVSTPAARAGQHTCGQSRSAHLQ